MALRDIKPTRSELINLKRKIQLSERGYKILKMKRDGLILEFFKILANAKDSKGELLVRYQRAAGMMALATGGARVGSHINASSCRLWIGGCSKRQPTCKH